MDQNYEKNEDIMSTDLKAYNVNFPEELFCLALLQGKKLGNGNKWKQGKNPNRRQICDNRTMFAVKKAEQPVELNLNCNIMEKKLVTFT